MVVVAGCAHTRLTLFLAAFSYNERERNVQAGPDTTTSYSPRELQQWSFLTIGTCYGDASAHDGLAGMEAC